MHVFSHHLLFFFTSIDRPCTVFVEVSLGENEAGYKLQITRRISLLSELFSHDSLDDDHDNLPVDSMQLIMIYCVATLEARDSKFPSGP